TDRAVDRVRDLLDAGLLPRRAALPHRSGNAGWGEHAADPVAGPRPGWAPRDRHARATHLHVDVERIPHPARDEPLRHLPHRTARPRPVQRAARAGHLPARGSGGARRPTRRRVVPVPAAPLHPRDDRGGGAGMSHSPAPAFLEVDLGAASREAGIVAGFTTRAAGNLALDVGDDSDRVRARRETVAALAGRGVEFAHHVHGTRVLDPQRPEAAAREDPVPDPCGDAWCAEVPAGLGVLAADCLPVLFADPTTGTIGAAHA